MTRAPRSRALAVARSRPDVGRGEQLAVPTAFPRHVDGAGSKTVLLAADCSFEDFRSVNGVAHRLGLIGATPYRPDGGRGAVLETAPECRAHRCPAGLT